MALKNGVALNWAGLDVAVNKAKASFASEKKDMLETIGELLVSSTIERFNRGVSPDGKTWETSGRAWKQGLAVKKRKATKKRKAIRGRSETGQFGKTLLDTGLLRNSIAHAVAFNGVYVGSNLKYARIHQMGGRTGKRQSVTMPARPYLGVSKEDKIDVQQVMCDFLAGTFKG